MSEKGEGVMRRVLVVMVKVYLTCVVFFMSTSLILFFGTVASGGDPSISLFLIMWLGPIALGLVLGSPFGLWLLWTRWE